MSLPRLVIVCVALLCHAAATISPLHTTAAGGGLSTAYVGTTAQFTITAKDTSGTALGASGANEYFFGTLQHGTTGTFVDVQVADNGDGTYSSSYDVLLTGAFALSVSHGAQGGLYAAYYNNMYFSGTPTQTQIDSTIDFDWGTGLVTTTGADYISARWIGKLRTPHTETYTFFITADDAVRLWVNRINLVDAWNYSGQEHRATIALEAGKFYDIRVDYKEITGAAMVKLEWSSPQILREVVPSTVLFNTVEIDSSPFTVTAVAGPAAAPFTTASGNGLTDAIAGVQTTFTVQLADVQGNLIAAGGESAAISAQLTGANDAAIVSATVTDNNDGSYTITYTAQTAQTYACAILVDGNAIPSSPFATEVVSAPTCATLSTASGGGLTTGIAGAPTTFTLTARDEFGNLRHEGTDKPMIRLSGADELAATATFQGAGIYTVSYTATLSGQYTLTASLDGNDYDPDNEPWTIAITAASIHTPSSTATGTALSDAVSGVLQTVTITARDAFGNALTTGGDGPFSLTLTEVLPSDSDDEPVQLTGAVVDNNDGTYTATYTPTKAGDFSLAIIRTSVNEHIEDSPFTVAVAVGAPVASSSRALDGTADSSGALSRCNAGYECNVTVQLYDAASNALSSGGSGVVAILTDAADLTATVAEGGNTGGAQGSVTVTDNSDGTYTISYVLQAPTGEDAWSLSLTLTADGGSSIAGAPFSITLLPGPTCATTSTVAGAGLNAATAGLAAQFTLTARDEFGNPQISGGDTVRSRIESSGGGEITEGTVTDLGTGLYTIEYQIAASGTYSHHITIARRGLMATYFDSSDFTGPLALPARPANSFYSIDDPLTWPRGPSIGQRIDPYIDFDFGTAAPQGTSLAADYFSIRWEGLITAARTATYTFTLEADEGARLYIRNDLVIDALFAPRNQLTAIAYLESGSPVPFRLDYNEREGSAKVRLLWQSVGITPPIERQIVPEQVFSTMIPPLSVSPISLSVAPAAACATLSTVAGSAITALTAGTAAAFTITVRDDFGNQAAAGSFNPSFTVNGNAMGSITDDNTGSDGIIIGSFTPTAYAGDGYTIAIRLGGAHVQGSPFTVPIQPGATAASTSSAAGDGLSTATAGERADFIITAKDANSNNRLQGGDAVAVVLKKGPSFATASPASELIADNGDGTYTCSYVLQEATNYQLEVTLNGQAIFGSPFSVTVVPAAMCATVSVASSATGHLSAFVAGTSGTITVDARDAFSNVVPITDEIAVRARFFGPESTPTEKVSDVTFSATANPGECEASGSTANSIGVYSAELILSHGRGLKGDYFHNEYLASSPYATRVDPQILFDWGAGPLAPSIVTDYAGVRWTGTVRAPASESVIFVADATGGGARLYLDDTLIIDEWTSSGGTFEGQMSDPLVQDKLYSIKVEYRHRTGNAAFSLSWRSPSIARQVVPTSALFAYTDHIDDSPYAVSVSPAAISATKSYVGGDALDQGLVAGESSNIVLHARDQYDNTISSGGATVVAQITEDGAGAPTPLAVTDVGDGTYTIAAVANTAGTAVFEVTLGGTAVIGTPANLPVVAGDLDGTQSSVSTPQPGTTGAAGEPFTVTVTARDANSNVRVAGGDADSFHIRATGTDVNAATVFLDATLTDNNDGTYTATFTPKIVATYTLSYKTAQGVALTARAQPDTYTVTAARSKAVFATMAPLPVADAPIAAAAASATSFTVTARDSFGNLLVGQNAFIVATASPTDGVGADALSDTTNNGDGTFSVALTPQVTKEHTAAIRIAEEAGITLTIFSDDMLQFARHKEVVDAPQGSWPIGVAACDGCDVAGSFSAQYAGHLLGVADESVTFTLEASGGARLYIDGTAAIDTWSDTVPAASSQASVQLQNGVLHALRVDFRNRGGSAASVALKWNGATHSGGTTEVIPKASLVTSENDISGSPFVMTVNPGLLCATTSSIDGGAALSAVAGEEYEFVIQARDELSNDRTEGGDTVVATLSHASAGSDVTGTVTDNDDGTYSVAFTLENGYSGVAWALAVTMGGNAISGSPGTVTVSPAATSAASTTHNAPSSGTAGTTHTVTVSAFDKYGNAKTEGGDVFTARVITAADSTVQHRPVTDNTDGSYTFTFAATPTGTYFVHIGLARPGGLVGTYYATDAFTTPSFSRIDATVDFDWSLSPPSGAPAAFPQTNWSVRWLGLINVEHTDTYTFFVLADDGARLFVDDTVLLDQINGPAQEFVTTTITLTAGVPVDIRLEFRQILHTAAVRLSYLRAGEPGVKSVVPSSALYAYTESIQNGYAVYTAS